MAKRGRTPTAGVIVARIPTDQWDLLVATFQLVTKVTIEDCKGEDL